MSRAEKILIVDDDQTAAKVTRLQLIKMGYPGVSIARSAVEAIEKTESDCPDLLLMDIKLGDDLDGIDAAKIIMKEYKVPVIYVTAYSDKEILTRAMATNPLGYVNKPLRETDLKTTIALALERIKSMDSEQDESFYPETNVWQVQFICEPDGKIDRVTTAIKKKLFGLGVKSVEQVLPKNHRKLVSNCIKDGKSQLITGKIKNKDYSWRYVASQRNRNISLTITDISISPEILDNVIDQTILLEMLDNLSTGLMLVNENLKSFYANNKAEKLLSSKRGLKLVNGYLNCIKPDLTAALQRMVLNDKAKTLSFIEDTSDNSVHILVSPLKNHRKNYGLNLPISIAFIFESSHDSKQVEDIMRWLYNLSPSEARIAAHVVQTPQLDDVAKSLGITVNTVRTHLKRIYAKTGTNRLSALVHMIVTGPVGTALQIDN